VNCSAVKAEPRRQGVEKWAESGIAEPAVDLRTWVGEFSARKVKRGGTEPREHLVFFLSCFGFIRIRGAVHASPFGVTSPGCGGPRVSAASASLLEPEPEAAFVRAGASMTNRATRSGRSGIRSVMENMFSEYINRS
jgi:hypothetical protein